jgi:hypothetical protein
MDGSLGLVVAAAAATHYFLLADPEDLDELS